MGLYSTPMYTDLTAKQQREQYQQEVSARKVRTVSYQTENHIEVLTQIYGSVWPRVLPYCIFNILITSIIYYLREYKSIDLTFSDRGHTFMSLMVSFLVVTRSNIAYSRYMEARQDLNLAMKACRELTQHMITFTRYELGADAKKWRSEIARRTVVLLRTAVSVLEYETTGQHAWKIPELNRDEKQALILTVGKSNERVPMVLTVFLRSAIASQREYLEHPMHVNRELRLYQFVSDFVTAYHGLMKIVTTPFPFPLVQMARTFLFLWVFTLPFAIENDIGKLPALVMIIFFVTYGFIGLEFVSIELDDPFGDDPNDFDVLGLAKVVFEDIYLYVFDIDGKEAVDALRKSIEDPIQQLKTVTSEKPKHLRYNSIDIWNTAVAPTELKVGADRSQLLVATSECRPRSTSDVFRQQHNGDIPVSVMVAGNERNAALDHTSSLSPIRGNFRPTPMPHQSAISSINGDQNHTFCSPDSIPRHTMAPIPESNI